MNDDNVKRQVRQFYDQVGWQVKNGNNYQNDRYEDLRPVSAKYIHRCHLRINRHIKPKGQYFLDAGSGPIQYPEYLTYSQGYSKRVCVDLSIVALNEARNRIGEHGLFILADVAALPFKSYAFDAAISLHTFHHLPANQNHDAYLELLRVLKTGSSAVVVNGWTDSRIMRRLGWLIQMMENIGRFWIKIKRKRQPVVPGQSTGSEYQKTPAGTFIHKNSPSTLRQELLGTVVFDILVWRSINVRFMRAVIHQSLGGKLILEMIYKLEEMYPRYFGENGQYPLIIIRK
jgi:SAM-dependent methyltransferase